MNIERYGLRGVVTPLLVADMDFDPDGVYEMAVFDSASSTPLDGFERFAPSLADRAIIVFHNTGDANGDVAKGIESLISSGQIEGIHLSTPRGIFVGSLKALNKNDHS